MTKPHLCYGQDLGIEVTLINGFPVEWS